MSENEKNINSPNEENESKEDIAVSDDTYSVECAAPTGAYNEHAEKKAEEETSVEENTAEPEVVYAYKWTYSDQFANDKKIDNANRFSDSIVITSY